MVSKRIGRPYIKAQFHDNCADCGAPIKPGDLIKHYGPGRVYGTTCHEQKETPVATHRKLRVRI